MSSVKNKPNGPCPCGSKKKYKKCCFKNAKKPKFKWTDELRKEVYEQSKKALMHAQLFYEMVENKPKLEVRPSPVHGDGVFAGEDIAPWTVATTYPVDIVFGKHPSNSIMYGRGIDVVKDADEALHLAKTYEMNLSPNDDVNVNRSYRITIAGHPEMRDGGVGHLLNDGGVMHKLSRSELKQYAEAIYTKVNCTSYHVGAYGIAIVTTKQIKKGEELFLSYGIPYWSEGTDYEIFYRQHKDITFKLYKHGLAEVAKCEEALEDLIEKTKGRKDIVDAVWSLSR